MNIISLKLSDKLLEESDRCAKALQLSRAEYIRRAILQMNCQIRDRLRAQRMAEVSQKVRKESMRVNAEFAAIERDPDA